jgi:L-threonylcarbamoyladenylate synthase
MKTVLTKSTRRAAEFIKNGGLVAFPTETVYGLGADVFDEQAIKKIFVAKQRPSDNPLIAHVASRKQINELVSEITQSAEKFIEAFFPAPLTLVLPKSARVPLIATANLQTIGVRMPHHDLARKFLNECGSPLVAPSANLSGKPSPTTWQAVFEDLNERIDCILQGEQTEIGLESTVVDCTKDFPLVLRVGAVSLEELQKVVPETRIYKSEKTENLPSPGLKYRHYSPRAKVVLFQSPKSKAQSPQSSAFIGLDTPDEEFALVNICSSVEEYAHEVFAFFREADAAGIKTIFCQTVEEAGIGRALIDRLKRAASD